MPARKDIRGRTPKAGDIVAVGVTQGSSGGWLDIRRVVKVEAGKVFMQGKGPVFPYTARSGYLILPKTYADAINYDRWA